MNYLIYKKCQSVGVRPELEKSKVLLGSISQDGLGRRQAADTFVSSGAGIKIGKGKKRNLLQVALDVGIINPQAGANLIHVARETLGAVDRYTERKSYEHEGMAADIPEN